MDMNEQSAEAIASIGFDQVWWNCIRFSKIPSRRDVLDNRSRGCVVSVTVGRDSKCSCRARGKKGTSDGCIITSNAADIFRCYPVVTPWFLVRFARLPKEDRLDGYDREYLQQLAFFGGRKIV